MARSLRATSHTSSQPLVTHSPAEVLTAEVRSGCSGTCVLYLPVDIPACFHAGKPYWEAAGVAGKIELRIGPASATLDDLLQVLAW